MKRNLQALVRRIDALSLRERVFLFLSAATVVVAVADTLVISPQLALQRERGAQLARQNSELAQLRAQLAGASSAAPADSPVGRLQAALQATRQARQRLEAETAPPGSAASQARDGAAPARLPDLLARVLRRHEGLSLVRLAVAPADTGAPAAAPGPGALPGPGVQAVDLALSGPYLALAAYLAEIEATLPGLRWGPLRLEGQASATSPEPTALLTLQLWLPSEQR